MRQARGCRPPAYTWPVNKQGGTDPGQNVFKTDLSKQQYPETDARQAALAAQQYLVKGD